MSDILRELHILATTLENDGFIKEASEVNNIFVKVAAKKSKKKKNVPNNPSLWASCKAWAKRTFDVYPSAYANGAAAKRYKSKGGTWRKANTAAELRLAQVDVEDATVDDDVTTDQDSSNEKNPSDDGIAEKINIIRKLDEQAESHIRQHNYNSAQLMIDKIQEYHDQNPGEVARVAKLVIDRLNTYVNLGRQKYPVEEPEVIKEMSLKEALEEVKETIFDDGEYEKARKFVENVKLTDGNKDYLNKMLYILTMAKKANPTAKMETYIYANQLLYEAKQKAQRSNQSSNLNFENIGKTDELTYNYLRKMVKDDSINKDWYEKKVYQLALELARLKSKI
jgi:hypothetical protein